MKGRGHRGLYHIKIQYITVKFPLFLKPYNLIFWAIMEVKIYDQSYAISQNESGEDQDELDMWRTALRQALVDARS